jgi:hypothetical protein
VPAPGCPCRAARAVDHPPARPPCRRGWGLPRAATPRFRPATACGLRRPVPSSPLHGWSWVACGGRAHPRRPPPAPLRSCPSPAGGAVTPAASRILWRRFVPLVRRVSHHHSAMDARRDTDGWLALTRQGLSPCKRRPAYLGAITLRLRRCRKRKRGTSGRWRQSAAGGL